MDKASLPEAPAGLCWRAGAAGQPQLFGVYMLPDGRRVERSTGTNVLHMARRQYLKMQRDIVAAWADGTLAKLLGTRGTRSDKGKPRTKPAVKQVDKSET